MNVFVAEKTDSATGEARQAGHGDRLKLRHFRFHLPERVGAAFRDADDGSRIGAEERIPSDVLTAFDRFEQERRPGLFQFLVSGDRCLGIGQHFGVDRNQIPLLRELDEFGFGRRDGHFFLYTVAGSTRRGSVTFTSPLA